ncbi:LysR family transcriptional regulator [Ramlibacter tataouinensis]|uniref:Transcriptional regulator, LysR family-like protein n=1 Tax=Ramlibacter tataouinensis (strain ATCC BAA-407 / DSM 14655 / LMG 21543 / TTB310) TaxID=365046 RepID=F5Y3C5_RAMTT|nr:LysR family transcriptional regulator [Ramlibacter tataouinensis]AEG91212.1 transcriptional regulator, LysR family-like protein [Ramlibacter tataouinensis TTB310]
MKLSFFATLDAVLRTGSLAGAAREMHVTPSAVSMQMKQLETHFGQPLFDRSGLSVRARPIALEIAETMRETLGRLESLRRRTGARVEGQVRLGVIETMQATLLPAAMVWLRAQHPALHVRPVRGRSVELLEAVKGGELDAAVVVQPSTGGSQRLLWHPVLHRELVLLAPPDAVEARAPALLKAHEWIRFDPETGTGRLAARWVRKHAPGARPTIDLQSVHAIVAMVSAGLGVSVVPEPDARTAQAHRVRIVRLGRDAPTLQVALVARPADADGRKLQALRDAMAAALVQAAGGARR